MSDIIFVKTRYQDKGYASYNDFWRLVELADYPVCYVDEIDAFDAGKTYIVTPLNDEWLTGWPRATARIVHWELEWRTDWRAEVDEPPGVAEVWASDSWYASHIGAKYVPMGSDERLNPLREYEQNIDKINDVALLSYQTPRRQRITAQMRERGLKLAPVDHLWGGERSARLLESKLMVHVHQHDPIQTVAPLRWALAAAHKLPMVSETLADPGIFTHSYLRQSSYPFLAEFVALLARDALYGRYADYALALHDLLCERHTFKKCVEAAL